MITVIGDLPPAEWRRLNALLKEALDIEPQDRVAWLERLPPQDGRLRELLAQLLQADQQGGSESAATLAPLSPPGSGSNRREDKPGDCIGPYRLVRVLGQGGMAVVWLADQIDGRIARQVALKIPTAEWVDNGLADRIRRECAVLASLNHPNVAQLYDAGWADSDLPYLAMEVVDGLPIDRHCAEHRLDLRARVRLFVEAVRAVAYAHARLVVHRDLKPANVLVTRDGRVKLLDFGIAKVLSNDQVAVDSELTRSSGRPVTLSYAAPEQILARPVTTATDIYTLGMMLFELLCGQRPFRSQPDTRSAVEEAMARGDAPAPSALAAEASTVRALRGDLDLIVRKALRKDPEQRYVTAAAFADDLERYLDGRVIHAQRASGWYRLRRFVGRNPVAVAAASTATVALLAGLSIALWQSRRAEVQANNAAAIGNFVLAVIQQADPNATQQTKASDLALLHTIEQRIDKDLPKGPAMRFALRLAVATAYRNRGEREQAATLLRAAVGDAASAPELDPLERLRAEVLLGETTENDQEVSDLLGSAIPRLRVMGRRAAPLLVDALLARIPTERHKDPRVDAQIVREALTIAEKNLGMADERTLKAAAYLAGILGPGNLNLDGEAVAVLEPVLKAVAGAHRIAPGNPTLLEAQSTLGIALCSIDRDAEGIAILERALQTAVQEHHDGKQLRGALFYLARGQKYSVRYRDAISTYASIYALLAAREPYASRFALFLWPRTCGDVGASRAAA